MGQYMPEVNALGPVINLGNEAILIALDVENSPLIHRISTRECFVNLCKVLPYSPFCNAKPDIQRHFQLTMPDSGFL
jgi:hypothetical protein